MKLCILRHGPAGTQRLEDDFARPLTKKGRKEVKKISKALKRLGEKWDRVLASPLARTRETADIVCRVHKLQRRLEEKLSPDRDPEAFLPILTRLQKRGLRSVLLVGHEPFLSHLICLLLGCKDSDSCLKLKKTGYCIVDLDGPRLLSLWNPEVFLNVRNS